MTTQTRALTALYLVVCLAFTSCVAPSHFRETDGGNYTSYGRFVIVSRVDGGTAKIWLGVQPKPNETFKWKGEVDSEGYATGLGSFVTLSSDWGLTTFSTGQATRGRMEGTMLKYVHWEPQRAVYLLTFKNGKVTKKTKVANTLEEWRRQFPLDDAMPRHIANASEPTRSVEPAQEASSSEGTGAGALIALGVIAVAAYGVYKLFGGGSTPSPSYSSDNYGHSDSDYDDDNRFYSASGTYSGYHKGSSLYSPSDSYVGKISDGTIYDSSGTIRGKLIGTTVYSPSSTTLGSYSGRTVYSPSSTTVGRASDNESADEAAAFFLGLGR